MTVRSCTYRFFPTRQLRRCPLKSRSVARPLSLLKTHGPHTAIFPVRRSSSRLRRHGRIRTGRKSEWEPRSTGRSGDSCTRRPKQSQAGLLAINSYFFLFASCQAFFWPPAKKNSRRINSRIQKLKEKNSNSSPKMHFTA